jgi:hypothetical protein
MNFVIFLILSFFVFSGCSSGTGKNPVGSDLKTIREEGRSATERGPQKPIVITKTEIVEKPQLVTREESTIDDKFIVITPDPQMQFNEGKKSSYKIRARVLMPGIQIKLEAKDLPDGATLTPSNAEKDLYVLSWTPPYYTVPLDSEMKMFTTKLSASITSADSTFDIEKLKNLVRGEEIPLFLFRTKVLPSDLKILGLPPEIIEGENPILFKITVNIPGSDDKAPQKPKLVVSYDGVSTSSGNDFLELDGTRHILPDPNRKDATYLGNGQWEFSRIFDTHNISVQPQLDRNGTEIPNADGTRVRISFKVFNSSGLSTPESLVQIKIKYKRKEI